MQVRYAPANAKLSRLAKRLGVEVYSFDMLSGVTCPGAKDCKSWAQVQADGSRRIVAYPRETATPAELFDKWLSLLGDELEPGVMGAINGMPTRGMHGHQFQGEEV